MKRRAIVVVTNEMLAAALGLPVGVEIIGVAESESRTINDRDPLPVGRPETISFKLGGPDSRLPEVPEGDTIPQLSLHEVRRS